MNLLFQAGRAGIKHVPFFLPQVPTLRVITFFSDLRGHKLFNIVLNVRYLYSNERAQEAHF